MRKLNRDCVAQVLSRLQDGARGKDVARDLGVAPQTISRIRTGKAWPDAEGRRASLRLNLSAERRAEIVAALQGGRRGKEVAAMYGLSPATVSRLKHAAEQRT